MSKHHVGPVTAQRAMARLVGEGLIVALPGQGTFIADIRPPPVIANDFGWQSMALGAGRVSADALEELIAPAPAGTIALSTGYLPVDLQPLPQLAQAMARAVRRPGVWDQIPAEGHEPLRNWFAREIGGGVHAHDVIICPGSQASIATVFRALAAPGSAILVESPTYIGAITAARAAGLRLVPVSTDSQGACPEHLAAAFASSGARVFYCQPTYANPTGVVLAPARREALLDVVAASGAFLVEDDWARDMDLEGSAPPPLLHDDRNGRVVYIRSLTKPSAPGLRVGAICARGAVFARLKAMRTIDDFFVAGALQESALQLVTAPAWRRHLRTMRAVLRQRREFLVEAVCNQLGSESLALGPAGGFHLWVRLPQGVSDVGVAAQAARESVIVSPGQHWFPAEAPGPFLRLTFAGAPEAELKRGVSILATVVERHVKRARNA